MKVAFLVGQYPVLSQTFVINQVIGLLDRGHDVRVIALEGAPRDSIQHEFIQKYHHQYRINYSPQVPENYFIRLIKAIQPLLHVTRKKPWLLLSALALLNDRKAVASLRWLYATPSFLEQETFDIIHCQFGVYGLQASLLREIGAIRGKLVVTFRGFDITEYPQRCGERVYEQLFKRADFFLTNCHFFRQKAIELGCQADSIQVLGSAIDCSRFTLTPRSREQDALTHIISVGRLVEKKGIEYGIRAISHLLTQGLRVEYTIVGDGMLYSALQDLIESLGWPNRIRLVGGKTQNELIALLKDMHILIAPSVTAQNGDQDAAVNTLKEAMAMGMPVIGTDHGGIPELIQDGVSGFLVPERDALAIAAKVEYLIKHPEIWPTMGQEGHIFVKQHYDMGMLNDKLVEIYQTLLNPS